MNKKCFFSLCLIGIIFFLFIVRSVFLCTKDKEYYLNKYEGIKNVYVSGPSAPRGRILDINGKVIVDNKGVNTIYYHKLSNATLDMEIDIAKSLARLTNYVYLYDEDVLKDYYLIIKSSDVDKLITEEEKKLYNERKISKTDLENLKKSRITDRDIENLSLEEKCSSKFYYLMNDGYMYDNKIILKDIDDALYANIIEAHLKGIYGGMEWVRDYPYFDSMKSVLGSVSNSLTYENRELLNKGYSLNDKIGISGLEEEYEEYLKGEKALYKVNSDNTLELIKNEAIGNDLILEVDIDIQVKVENIIKEQILKAKKTPNTEYYKESYAMVSDPSSGGVRAIAGIRLIDLEKKEFGDVSINVVKNAYAMGSAVKAASMTVGYNNKIIDIGTEMTDSCVKLYNKPSKCSFTRLGWLNDVRALQMSSNYYQFIIALGIMGYKYEYNIDPIVNIEHFNKYRSVFNSYGLGVKTGIDLPGEIEGLEGNLVSNDLLLNLAIGQYDLYTPTSLLQYASTLANKGNRIKLSLMNKIVDRDGKIILENKSEVLNKVNIEEKYMNRIHEGLSAVMNGSGTGYYYSNGKINAAGKTGTSEVLIDTDYNGTLDAYVVNNTFMMFAPYDNPKYSMVVISPNASNMRGKTTYRSGVNRLIARNISDFLFSS